jgi:hypothetical protein
VFLSSIEKKEGAVIKYVHIIKSQVTEELKNIRDFKIYTNSTNIFRVVESSGIKWECYEAYFGS